MSDGVMIGFAGMTHLGINSAVAAAERGFPVVCYDPDGARIAALGRGRLPVVEPGLPKLLQRNAGHITFTDDGGDLGRCDVVYIAADVPTGETGESDLGSIIRLIERVDGSLRDDAVLVVLSQVPPGFTRTLGRRPEVLYYQVETLIFGRAVERALHPERFIVGCADPKKPLPEALAVFLDAFGCPVLPMRYESAELAKISINCCLVASVSVANTLAELCEKIGAEWSEIAPALKLDRRIGEYAYLSPGLGIAGGNLERDLATVCRLAAANGSDAGVVEAWLANSAHRRDWVLSMIHREVLPVTPKPVIGILGLAYKQDTHSTKNSPALALLAHLSPFPVRVYDPVVAPDPAWHPDLTPAKTALEACQGADVLAIMTPWPVFRELKPKDVARVLDGATVIDPFAILDRAACSAAGLRQIVLGGP